MRQSGLLSTFAVSWIPVLLTLPSGVSVAAAPGDTPREPRVAGRAEGAPQKPLLEPEPGRCISGRVLTREGEPIPGARVQALEELAPPDARIEDQIVRIQELQGFSGKAAAESVSAGDGSYELAGLDLKHYTLRALASGFAPGQVAQVPAPRDQVDIRCEKGFDVVGTVKDTGGNPVVGARIHAYPGVEGQSVFDVIMAKARPPLDSTSSDASGAFVFRTLGRGVYDFLVTAMGHQDASFMKVATSATTEPLRFPLEPGRVIRGVVRGPGDAPVAGARVRVAPMEGTRRSTARANISFDDGSIVTDATGAFRFDTLGEGRHVLLAWHPDLETAQIRDLEAGDDEGAGGEEVVLRLGVGARLRGFVRDRLTGKPIRGARVTAMDVADLTKDAFTKEDGSYELSGLRVGARGVSLRASAKGYGRGGLERLRLEESAEVERDFELLPAGAVAGRIVTSAGKPLAGVRVLARRAQSGSGVAATLASDVTDQEGRYEILEVEAGEGTTILARRTEFLDGHSGVFSVEPGEAVELPDLALRPGGTVTGAVLGPDGRPAAGALVTVRYEGDTELLGRLNPSGSTNARGEYVIRGLRAGVVRLFVKPVRFLEKTVDGVRVEEGSTADVDIRLESGASLRGHVLDSHGEPIEGAEVLVRDFSRGLKELKTLSDADGRFTVEGISAKDFVEIAVSHEGRATFTDPKVAVGRNDLEVVLKAE